MCLSPLPESLQGGVGSSWPWVRMGRRQYAVMVAVVLWVVAEMTVRNMSLESGRGGTGSVRDSTVASFLPFLLSFFLFSSALLAHNT